ncbi:MAG: hypothetical protein DRQ03_03560 [Candidatus Hydrothermota bacterium]|nr:MAG: hypothetical protein DRQ03_03560 [Candidatus Hydrothermae bacterium]
MKAFKYLVLVLSLPVFLFAGETGKLMGTVRDAKTGEGLPGANVIIEELNIGTACDLDGSYVIINIPPGTYTIKASMVGYRTVIEKNVKIRADLTTELNFRLEEATIMTEPIIVTAREPVIKKDVTSSVITSDKEELNKLPVETVTDVLSKKAGITVDPGGGIHVRGGRSGEVLYLIDGIPVVDPYSNSLTISIPQNIIRQLDLVAGTFNAEYGNAMSGVVNIITDEGGNRFTGNINFSAGDKVSNHSDIFEKITTIDPLSRTEINGSISGPIVRNKINFYIGGRRYYSKGWLYGQRIYLPTDQNGEMNGDSAWVPMNPSYNRTINGKIAFKITPKIKITSSTFYSYRWWKSYVHSYKYNPSCLPINKRLGIQEIVNFNHVISSKTYYSIKAAYSYSPYEQYVYENPYDYRYKFWHWYYGSGLHFDRGGVSNYWYKRWTKTIMGKAELQSQIAKSHLVKAGIEAKRYEIYRFSMYITNPPDTTEDIKLTFPVDDLSILPVNDTVYDVDQYMHHPIEFAAYMQDKIEMKDMVINVGVRFDYYDPKWKIWADDYAPSPMAWDTLRGPYPGFKDVEPKYQLSPRIGIAFPVSAQGIFHFSYGHFFQIPPYLYLYRNSDFEMGQKANTTWMGNPDLRPQRTVAYEVGYKQAISDNIGFEITGYYKDIRDLLATKLVPTYVQGDNYTVYTNRDYANVRGISTYLKFRDIGNFSFEIDYTYQIAEGSNSAPRDLFADIKHGVEEPKTTVPLDWDERHKINGTITYHKPKNFTISLIGTYGSGLPYTPTDERGNRIGDENSGRKPPRFNIDLFADKYIITGKATLKVFLKIYNLLDRMNEEYVFSSTGRATYTRSYNRDAADPGWWVRPHYFSPPRTVIIGMGFAF